MLKLKGPEWPSVAEFQEWQTNINNLLRAQKENLGPHFVTMHPSAPNIWLKELSCLVGQ